MQDVTITNESTTNEQHQDDINTEKVLHGIKTKVKKVVNLYQSAEKNTLSFFLATGEVLEDVKGQTAKLADTMENGKVLVNVGEKVIDITKVKNFFSYLAFNKILPFGYHQASKYMACALQADSFNALTKEQIVEANLSNLNNASKLAKYFADGRTFDDYMSDKETTPTKKKSTAKFKSESYYANSPNAVSIKYNVDEGLKAAEVKLMNRLIEKYGAKEIAPTTLMGLMEDVARQESYNEEFAS